MHFFLILQRELRRLCDEGDLLTSVRIVSIQLNTDSDYLCHTVRFIGHYWIKLEDFHELVTHNDNAVDLSLNNVTLISDEEFIGLREKMFCRLNLTTDNCTLLTQNWPQESSNMTEILIKFNKYPLVSGGYQSLRTYIVILIVVMMCVTFTAVIHVTQKSVSEWKKKLNHQYIFVVDNK